MTAAVFRIWLNFGGRIALPAPRRSHSLFAGLVNELKAVGVVEDFGESRADFFRVVNDLDGGAEHFSLNRGKRLGELRAGPREGNGEFAKADELFGRGSSGGDRQVSFVQAVAIGVGDNQ